MMSNFCEISGLKYRSAPNAKFTPEPPGPPGSISSEPIRFAGSVALRRATATFIFSPLGFAQSIGTVTVPQSTSGCSWHGVHLIVSAVSGAALAATLPPSRRAEHVNATPSVRIIGCTGFLPRTPWLRPMTLPVRENADNRPR